MKEKDDGEIGSAEKRLMGTQGRSTKALGLFGMPGTEEQGPAALLPASRISVCTSLPSHKGRSDESSLAPGPCDPGLANPHSPSSCSQ